MCTVCIAPAYANVGDGNKGKEEEREEEEEEEEEGVYEPIPGDK